MPFEKLKNALRELTEVVESLSHELDDDSQEQHMHAVQRSIDKSSADMETATFWAKTALASIIKAKNDATMKQARDDRRPK